MNIICILCNARKGPWLENKMFSIQFYSVDEKSTQNLGL